ncbi:MAG: hypothetical protein Q8O10_05910 [candidate division Zixibacteria bacterium]|nr:hypothetical protein [candidate division Zixibacteria bacterium]
MIKRFKDLEVWRKCHKSALKPANKQDRRDSKNVIRFNKID